MIETLAALAGVASAVAGMWLPARYVVRLGRLRRLQSRAGLPWCPYGPMRVHALTRRPGMDEAKAYGCTSCGETFDPDPDCGTPQVVAVERAVRKFGLAKLER